MKLRNTVSLKVQVPEKRGDDGGRVRRGDHLPPQRYIRNTSTRGTAPIEHPLNADRRPQTCQKSEPCG